MVSTLDEHKVKQIKADYPKAFSPWSKEDDKRLSDMVEAKELTVVEMAEQLGRQPSAVNRRIQILGYPKAVSELTKEVDYLDRRDTEKDKSVVGQG